MIPRIASGAAFSDWLGPIFDMLVPEPKHNFRWFECADGRCQSKNGRDDRRCLDKGDAKSTSGLRRHATKCWGPGAETVESADGTNGLKAARAVLQESKLRDGTITAAFERIRRSNITFSHRQHTSTEAR